MKSKILPHRDTDAVLTLYAHYFLAANLMLKNYMKLRVKWNNRGQLSQNDRVQLSIYFCSWLGFLGVTAEGFKKLTIRKLVQENRPPDFNELVPLADQLGAMLKKHDDALRRFRNAVFHLRDSAEEVQRFFHDHPTRLIWAEELQQEFDNFFSNYRILCQVHYVHENRTNELFN